MWTNLLQRLDDRCPSFCNPWLRECVSTWPQNAGDNPSRVVACLLLGGPGTSAGCSWSWSAGAVA